MPLSARSLVVARKEEVYRDQMLDPTVRRTLDGTSIAHLRSEQRVVALIKADRQSMG